MQRYCVEIIVHAKHLITVDAANKEEAADKVLGNMDWGREPEDIQQEPVFVSEIDDEPSAVYVPCADGKYHIGDGYGGTLCGVPMSGLDPYCTETCATCENIAEKRSASLKVSAADK